MKALTIKITEDDNRVISFDIENDGFTRVEQIGVIQMFTFQLNADALNILPVKPKRTKK
jgi:hypothetical protein